MPLPEFLRKKSPRSNVTKKDKNPPSSARSSVQILEEVQEELFPECSLPNGFVSSCNSNVTTACLPRTVRDVISDSKSLEYFCQFMETQSAVSLVNFCTDVKFFKSNAANIAKCLSEAKRLRNTENGSGNTTATNKTFSFDLNEFLTADPEIFNSQNFTSFNQDVPKVLPASPSSLSIDSGILVNQTDATTTSTAAKTDVATSSNENAMSSEEQLLLNQTREALSIYQRYIAPESPNEIELPSDARQAIVVGICSESGQVDPSCFDEAVDKVIGVIQSRHFQQFQHSRFYTQLIIDTLTSNNGRNISISDVLNNDVLLFYFMEFLDSCEGRQHRPMVDFWICVQAFKQRATEEGAKLSGDSFLQNEAIIIYEKFISLQAPSHLGFGTNIRFGIETSICSESGHIDSTCFDAAVTLVQQVLHIRYLQKFINFNLFKNYITELKSSIISSSPDEESDMSKSSISLNTSYASSELGSAQVPISSNVSETSSNNFDAKNSCRRLSSQANSIELFTDPDHLWKRKSSSITNIGHVDSLGRYTSNFELPPDLDGGSRPFYSIPHSEAMGSKISRAVRRMISSTELEKDKEELAWQMAHMIVSQVTTRSNGGIE